MFVPNKHYRIQFIFISLFVLINAQEIDTLYYFDKDSIQECAYSGDVLNLGVNFIPDSTWYKYSIIEVQLQSLSLIGVSDQEWLYFHSSDDSTFPADIIDSVLITIEDSTELYPGWKSIDLTSLNTLNNLSGNFYITGQPLLSSLCDFSTPSGHSYWYSIFYNDWLPSGDFPLKVIVQRKYVNISNNDVDIPNRFLLMKNYPNPFNATTTIAYQLPEAIMVNLTIYDITGQLVETLVNVYQNPGTYYFNWNARSVSSGVYFYRISTGSSGETGKYLETKKCLIIK